MRARPRPGRPITRTAPRSTRSGDLRSGFHSRYFRCGIDCGTSLLRLRRGRDRLALRDRRQLVALRRARNQHGDRDRGSHGALSPPDLARLGHDCGRAGALRCRRRHVRPVPVGVDAGRLRCVLPVGVSGLRCRRAAPDGQELRLAGRCRSRGRPADHSGARDLAVAPADRQSGRGELQGRRPDRVRLPARRSLRRRPADPHRDRAGPAQHRVLAHARGARLRCSSPTSRMSCRRSPTATSPAAGSTPSGSRTTCCSVPPPFIPRWDRLRG